MSQQEQFESLLTQLMSPENDIRGQAERFFHQTKATQPNEVSQALLQVSRTSTVPELRSFAIILLRRILVGVESRSIWSKINETIQNLIKRELLNGLERETDKRVLSSLRDITMDLAGQILEESPTSWNELLEWLVRVSQSADGNHKQSVLSIFSHISPYVAEAFNNDQFFIIKNLLQSGFNDPQIQVKLSALEATVGFAQVFNLSGPRKELQSMVPLMLDVLACALNSKDEESAQTALKTFIDIGELDPGFLKNSASMIVDAMIKICKASELDDSTRQLALEFSITFIENKPNLCKSIPGFIPTLINLLLELMLDMDDQTVEEWNSDDQDNSTENSIVAQENLDRLCLALKGENILPVIFEHIPKLIATKDSWQCRHVGLMALSMIGEGCRDLLKPHLDKIVQMVIPTFSDTHPRVRWAAANTAGQMSTDFGPKFQKLFHAEILPRFVQLLDDSANPKVQAHVAAATINFCEKFDSKTITQYLPDMLSRLIVLVQNGKRFVQEQAITAVASIASCAGHNFIPYYDRFIPLLKSLLVSGGKDLRMLRAKAMECISLVAVAVGKEKFKPDAIPIMDILAQIQNSTLEADDPQRDSMLQAWTRISTCLGEEFVPYLKFVMPPLIQAASKSAGVHLIEEGQPNKEEDGWDYVVVGDAKIAIHTSALEEKASACNLLYSYASEMKDGFFPYVEEVSKLCVPLMTFYYNETVRISSLNIMPQLLQSARIYLEKHNQDKKLLNELFAYIYPHLIEAISRENDQEVLVVGIEALHGALTQMSSNSLPPEKVKELLHLIKVLIVGMQKRRAEALAHRPEEDDIDESINLRNELTKEDDIANELAELVGAIVKNHPTVFLPNFTDIFTTVMDMLQKNKPPSERQLALCIFDDIVEHTQQQSHQLFPHFLPLMMEYGLDPHYGVRQAACFGLGVCAQYGGDAFKPATRQTLEILVTVITRPDSRVDRNAPPTENAISSVGKIMLYQTDQIQERLSEVIDMYVSWLPIVVDWIEAKVVHQQLIDLLKRFNAQIFGKDFKNLPKILSIFSEIVPVDPSETVLITVKTRTEILQVLQSMQQQFPGQLLQQAFASLSPEHQQRLQKIMSGQLPPITDDE